MARLPRIYWDACAWIAYIAQEKAVPLKGGGVENRYAMCQSVLQAAKEGKLELVTSCFTLAEVCKNPDVRSSPVDNLPAFFERSFILAVPVDLSIGRRAQYMQASGIVNLKPPDAIHLASAQRAMADEMHSFDGDILGLSEKIVGHDGKPLKICKPGGGLPKMPLFEEDHE